MYTCTVMHNYGDHRRDHVYMYSSTHGVDTWEVVANAHVVVCTAL